MFCTVSTLGNTGKLKTTLKKVIWLLAFVFLPLGVWANGGDQRVAEGKYVINLSRVPFTPRAGEQAKLVVSFGDLQKDALITEDLIVNIRIAKQGGLVSGRGSYLFEKNNILVQGGVLELPYTFTESGLHEIWFDFAFSADPKKVYSAPDFLLDVQEPVPKKSCGLTPSGNKETCTPTLPFILGIGIGSLVSAVLYLLIIRKKVNP